ncbi:MAG TPA: hypothetical protein VF735_09035 [Pyrinomonadaceae bacterium]|jgi:hypothetical protein
MRLIHFIIFTILLAVLTWPISAQERRRARLILKDRTVITGTITRMTSSEIELVEDSTASTAKLVTVKLSGVSNIEFIEDKPADDSASTQPSNAAPALTACGSTAVPTPELRSLRLGMSWEDYRKIPFGRVQFVNEPDELGVRQEHISRGISLSSQENEKLKGLELIRLTFIDDRLAKIELSYDDSVKWGNDLEFTSAIADSLKLPRTGWRGHFPTVLNCEAFKVETYSLGNGIGNRLIITKNGLEQEIARRRQQYEEKQKQTFKP